jgi:hypothetical protein
MDTPFHTPLMKVVKLVIESARVWTEEERKDATKVEDVGEEEDLGRRQDVLAPDAPERDIGEGTVTKYVDFWINLN